MNDNFVNNQVRLRSFSIDEKSGQIDETTLGGTKHDSGKPDLSLVPRSTLNAIAEALMYGEAKYQRYNYLRGFDSHRLIAATLRHLVAWQDGEDLDTESNLSHLSHALASLSMLVHCKEYGSLTDTRLGVKNAK